MFQLTIRPATDADAPALVALIRSAYRGEESRTGWTTEADLLDDERIDTAGVCGKISDPTTTVLAAVDADGALVACCEVQLRSNEAAYFGLFAVHPSLQAPGLGRRVLTAAERYAAQYGWSRMQMTVIAQRLELIAWYERRGYWVTSETRPFPYGAVVGGGSSRTDLHFVVLEKSLGDAHTDRAASTTPRSSDSAADTCLLR